MRKARRRWLNIGLAILYWLELPKAVVEGAGDKDLHTRVSAMLDEMDADPAMFKLAPTGAELPVADAAAPLTIDGTDLPSDWYLRLAGAMTRMLRADSPATAMRPSNP